MKADRRRVERALDRPEAETRLILLHGPDEAGSRVLAERMERALGAEAERVDLDGPTLARDPARLSDEAASTSLFGDRRHVRVRLAGDEGAKAIQALLEARVAVHPVVAVAGALKPSSATLKLVTAAANALAFASYVPEGREAAQIVAERARQDGLGLSREAAARIAAECVGDRLRIEREIEKLVLYADAAADRPRTIEDRALELLLPGDGSDAGAAVVDAAFGGGAAVVAEALCGGAGEDRTAMLRAAQRRVQLLAELRGRVDGGDSPSSAVEGAGRAIFWRDKPAVTRQLSTWTADMLDEAGRLLVDAERQSRGGAAGSLAIDQALLAMTGAAARRR